MTLDATDVPYVGGVLASGISLLDVFFLPVDLLVGLAAVFVSSPSTLLPIVSTGRQLSGAFGFLPAGFFETAFYTVLVAVFVYSLLRLLERIFTRSTS